MTSDSDFIEIRISQETEKIMQFSPFFVPLPLVLVMIWIFTESLKEVLIMLIIGGAMYGFIAWIMVTLSPAPADAPDSYRIYPDTNILMFQDCSVGPWHNAYLSTTYNVKYINRKFRKVLKILSYNENGEKWIASFRAPAFEKCHTEWRRLFNEIRSRIPEDAKIMIKDSHIGDDSVRVP